MPGKDPLVSGGAGLRVMKILENIVDANLHADPYYNTWDVCAPQAIAQIAGAYVADFEGKELIYTGQRTVLKQYVAARNKEIGEFAVSLFKIINSRVYGTY